MRRVVPFVVLSVLLLAGCRKYSDREKAREKFIAGVRFLNKAQYENALRILNEARSGYRNAEFPQGERDCLAYIGAVQTMLKNWDEALRAYDEALEANAKLENAKSKVSEGELHTAIATVYLNMGDLTNATTYAKKADAIFATSQRKEARLASGQAENVLAAAYGRTGDYQGALQTLKEAHEKLQGIAWIEAGILSAIGLLYNNMGDYDTALSYHNRALEATQGAKALLMQWQAAISMYPSTYEGGIDAAKAVLLCNRGVTRRNNGDYEGALQDFKGALQLLATQKNNPTVDIVEFNIGLTYLSIGDNSNAKKHICLSDDPFGSGQLALGSEDYEEALRCFTEALDQAQQSSDIDLLFAAHTGLGKAYEKQGRKSEAVRHFEQATSLAERILRSVPQDRKKFFDNSMVRGFTRSEARDGLARLLRQKDTSETKN